MRRAICVPAIFLLPLVLFSCSSARHAAAPIPGTTHVTIPADWGYQKAGISLHLKADPKLNLFRNAPHTLLICIYHLRDPNGFQQLQNEKDGLQKLLECSRFDPSVVHARSLVIQPGQEIDEVMDRADGARFVSIAAGYYRGDKKAATRWYAVPLADEMRGEALAQVTQRLSIHLYLGPLGLTELRPDGKTGDPRKHNDPERQTYPLQQGHLKTGGLSPELYQPRT